MPVALLSSTLVHLILSWKDWINKNNKKKKERIEMFGKMHFYARSLFKILW